MDANLTTGPETYRVRDLEHPGEHVDIIGVSGGHMAALNHMYMTARIKGWKHPRLSVIHGDSETEVPQ